MGDLLHLRDEHEQAQMLLPWHVNGTLERGEAAWLETHLAQCAECRADLADNRTLRREIATMPLPATPARLPAFERIAALPKPRAPRRPFLRRRVTLGWALAAPAAIAAAVTLFLVAPTAQPEDEYRLLGSEPDVTGNAILLFSPDTTERELRTALARNRVRLVDGPTASGAYLVRVPGSERDEVLGRLRQMPQVILAEPLDGGDAR